jgi:hypothetical protein
MYVQKVFIQYHKPSKNIHNPFKHFLPTIPNVDLRCFLSQIFFFLFLLMLEVA